MPIGFYGTKYGSIVIPTYYADTLSEGGGGENYRIPSAMSQRFFFYSRVRQMPDVRHFSHQ